MPLQLSVAAFYVLFLPSEVSKMGSYFHSLGRLLNVMDVSSRQILPDKLVTAICNMHCGDFVQIWLQSTYNSCKVILNQILVHIQ